MLQVAALEIIHSEFHFTMTQSKYWLEAREGGLGELMKPWGKRIVFRKKNVMGIQTDGRVKFAPFYSASCSGRIFWKLEWRSRQKNIYIYIYRGTMVRWERLYFPKFALCQAVSLASSFSLLQVSCSHTFIYSWDAQLWVKKVEVTEKPQKMAATNIVIQYLTILWPPDVKSQLFGKDLDAGKDGRREEKGTTGDEMAGWHHRLDRHEFE